MGQWAVTTFRYDAAGQRIATSGPTGDLLYGWNSARRLASTSSDGGLTEYTYAPDGLLASTSNASGSRGSVQVRYAPHAQIGASDRRTERTYNARRHGPGDLIAHPDGTGLVLHGYLLGRRCPDAGNRTSCSTARPRADVQSQPPDGVGDFGYTGEYTEPSTGLVNLRQRWYDPTTGLMLSTDPFSGELTIPASLHDYLYVHGDPVNLTDPSGLTTLAEQLNG